MLSVSVGRHFVHKMWNDNELSKADRHVEERASR